jgi:hypothetical protein
VSGGTEHLITDEAALNALYGTPALNSIRKEVPVLTPAYRAVIEAALKPKATHGATGASRAWRTIRGSPHSLLAKR